MEYSLDPPIFLKRFLVFHILLFSSISLYCLLRLSYLSLLFLGTFHSDWYIFPFLLCLSLLFFFQVRPPEKTILAFFFLGMVLITTVESTKTRPGAGCGSDHELLIAKFRLKLKKVGEITKPFRYDLNQNPYDYTVEGTNRFKGLDLTRQSAWRAVNGGA